MINWCTIELFTLPSSAVIKYLYCYTSIIIVVNNCSNVTLHYNRIYSSLMIFTLMSIAYGWDPNAWAVINEHYSFCFVLSIRLRRVARCLASSAPFLLFFFCLSFPFLFSPNRLYRQWSPVGTISDLHPSWRTLYTWKARVCGFSVKNACIIDVVNVKCKSKGSGHNVDAPKVSNAVQNGDSNATALVSWIFSHFSQIDLVRHQHRKTGPKIGPVPRNIWTSNIS